VLLVLLVFWCSGALVLYSALVLWCTGTIGCNTALSLIFLFSLFVSCLCWSHLFFHFQSGTPSQMISKTYKPKELLFLQGQKGHHYWIIIQGQVKIYIEDNKHDEQVKLHNYTNQGTEWCNNVLECDPNWLGREVARMNGGGFGELALFEGTGLRNASAATSGEEKIEMIGLPKHIYLRTISYMHREAFVTKRKINFLKQLPLFQTWSQRRVVDTAYSMERVHFSKGSVLVEQNSEPGCLFFIGKS